MISLNVIGFILITHFVADFIFQSHDVAKRKSTSNYYLTVHVSIYSLCWIPFSLYYFSSLLGFGFILFTFITHWITDYISSRITSFYFKNNDFHNFFVVVGADQMLHYMALILSYTFLSGAFK